MNKQDRILQNKINTTQAVANTIGKEGKVLSDNRPIIQKKANNTGLPDNLKSGIENLSGHTMDDVKVHYNSDKPAQLNAHAYAQGSEIHLASGQEKHLPHEAWHVVQQKQGRVKPTMQMKGKVNINDDKGLETEADIMGAKALQMKPEDSETSSTQSIGFVDNRQKSIKQRKLHENFVIQRGKKKKANDEGNDSDIEIDSELEDNDGANKKALARGFKSGRVPKKTSKQMERVLKLRKKMRKDGRKSGKKYIIKAHNLQKILADLNLEYSPQNTTALGIGGSGNQVVTKMGGANANYLASVLKAQLTIEKKKSPKNSNINHAEKALSRLRKQKFRRLIIDKNRCDICKHDKTITDSAKIVRD
ncbi:eCIS core domain-containing protein [Flavobacterium sp. HNIBRBA15423]|uniref:eCIS core domain-containing protein n=1 Tax=Flavobacterium sp. HNIBRBA15423 TaxID=3458683 RepID=UPI0040446256